jgi:hypothetical protein
MKAKRKNTAKAFSCFSGQLLFGRWLVVASMAFAMIFANSSTLARSRGSSEEEEETLYQYQFCLPSQHSQTGTPPHEDATDHGHTDLSEAKLKANQEKVKKYIDGLRSEGRTIGLRETVEIYYLAEDFRVIHSLLGDYITEAESVQIGKSRQAVLDESLDLMARNKKAGRSFGINDFGSGAADPDAKTDIDFTLYGDRPGHEMLKAFMEAFGEVTRKYGRALNPGQADIVAHRYEAVIPDWRQSQCVSNFVAKMRKGTGYLKANPEAYFLEGAYVQQIMGRSVEAKNKTYTEISLSDDGVVVRTQKYAIDVPDFFYKPEIRARYGWGGAVGNWHFWLAHAYDTAAAAKYLLRSVNDGKRLTIEPVEARRGDYETLSKSARTKRVRDMYGSQYNAESLKLIQSVLDTAVNIRKLKKAKTLNLSTETGKMEAYRPIIEYERARSPIAMTDGELLLLATDRYVRTSKKVLIQNNIDTAPARLTDWLAPRVPEKPVIAIDEDGNMTKIKIDPAEVKRLNYAAFFELRDAIALMDNKQISEIQRKNPKYHNDIEILKRLIETQKRMLDAPETLKPDEMLNYKERAIKTAMEDFALIKEIAVTKGRRAAFVKAAKTLYNRGNYLEQKFQSLAFDILESKAKGNTLVANFAKLRNAVAIVNERLETSYDPYLKEKTTTLLNASWMMRMNVSTSLMEVAKSYLSEGEINEAVLTTALYQAMGYVPCLGTLIMVQSGWSGVSTLVFIQLVPGYGQILTVLNLTRAGVEVAGMAVFEPLKQDKLLLYYQGYLDPAKGGLITTGQRERVESPMPALLHPVDPNRTLSLDERREKMYHYIYKHVAEKLRRDPAIWYHPEKAPEIWFGPERIGFKNLHEEFQKKEIDYMSSFVDSYVEDWWNARGVFSEYGEILAGRAKGPDLRRELKGRLKQDYIKGKNITIQKEIQQQEARRRALSEKMAEICGMDVALDKEKEGLGDVFLTAGKAAWAEVLEKMPAIAPAVEIIAAPRIRETDNLDPKKEEKQDVIWDVNFRAKINGSTKNNPAPWKVLWEVRPEGGSEVTFKKKGEAQSIYKNRNAKGKDRYFSKSGQMQVKAIAIDAKGKEFASGTLIVNIDKSSFNLPKKPVKPKESGSPKEPGTPEEEGKTDQPVEPEDKVKKPGEEEEEKRCEDAKEKVEEIRSSLISIKTDVEGTAQKIQEMEKETKILKGKYHQTEDYENEAYREAQKTQESVEQIEKLAGDICDKAKEVMNAASLEEAKRLLVEIQTQKEALLKLKNSSQESFNMAGKAADKAEQISTHYAPLLEEIKKLRDKASELESAVESIGKDIQQTKEEINQISTPSQPDQSALGEELAKCREDTVSGIRSREKDYSPLVGIVQELNKSVSVFDSAREWIEKIRRSAEEARASADAAKVYHKAEKYAGNAEVCASSAMADVEKKGQGALEKDSFAAIKSCNFKKAAGLIAQMPEGPGKKAVQEAYGQAKKGDDEAHALFENAQRQYKTCAYDETITTLNKAMDATPCADYQDFLKKKIAKVQKAKELEAWLRSQVSEANDAYRICEYDRVLEILNTALGKAKCEKHIKSLKNKIAMAQKAKDYESKTLALFQKANGLYVKGRFQEALGVLQEAQSHTKCQKYIDGLGEKIAKVKGKLKPTEKESVTVADGHAVCRKEFGPQAYAVAVNSDGTFQCQCRDGYVMVDNKCRPKSGTGAGETRQQGQEDFIGSWSGTAQITIGTQKKASATYELQFSVDEQNRARGRLIYRKEGDTINLTGHVNGSKLTMTARIETLRIQIEGVLNKDNARGVLTFTMPDAECLAEHVAGAMFGEKNNQQCPQRTYKGTWSASH